MRLTPAWAAYPSLNSRYRTSRTDSSRSAYSDGVDRERDVGVAQLTLGAHQALRDRLLAREKGAGNLADAEPAHGLERERHARVAREHRMARQKHHRELIVVGHRRLAAQPRIGGACGAAYPGAGNRVRAIRQPPFAAQDVERPMLRHLNQPGRRIRRHTGVRPRLQRLHERVLRDLLGQRHVPRAEDARERGDDPRGRLPKRQIVDDLRRRVLWVPVGH